MLNRRRLIYLCFALVIAIGAGAGVWLIANTKPIPAKYRRGLNYPLYYPRNLPAGFVVDPHSFERKGAVLVFSITAPQGKNIAVSEQHIPAGLDLSQKLPNEAAGVTIPGEEDFNTSAGAAQISIWSSGKLVCSLVTPNTWVILNVSGFNTHQIELVAQSFQAL